MDEEKKNNVTPEEADEQTDGNPTFDEQYAEVKYADFDKKSPLLSGGSYDDDEQEVTDEPSPEGPDTDEPKPDTKAAPVDDKPAPGTYKVLRVGEHEYRFNSEKELEQMATRGLYLGDMESRLKPYSDVIAAVENDPALGNAIAETIRNYRQGVPTQAPKPDADPDTEPEQGDDEDYDDYEKRLVKWREERTQRLIDQRIQETLQQRQTIARQSQISAANRQIINYVNADPERESVMAVIADPTFPAGLRQAMDYDGPTFMQVYDAIRKSQGKTGYFGAPDLPGFSPAQPRMAAPRGKAAATPYTESARRAPQATTSKGGVGDIPDVKTMSDEQFRAWKQNLKLNEFNK